MWPLFGITAVVLALMALLLNLNVQTRWPWPIKAVSIFAAFATVAGAYFAVKGLSGWPVRGSMPEPLQVLAIDVVEPDKTDRSPGAIYVWAKAADRQRPRAYAFAYSKALHQAAVRVQKRLRTGHQQGVRVATRADADQARAVPLTFYDMQRQLEGKTGLGR